jgi:microcin C transport system substrate-binding protein
MKQLFGVFFGLIFSSALSFSNVWAVQPNPNAPIGGTFNVNLSDEPSMLHPIMSTDGYSADVHKLIGDQLLARDPETYEWKPRLAEKYEISKDGKTYTFYLRKNAFFHDGTPITAEDVKFSYDAIFEPKYKAQQLIPYYDGLAKVEVVDPLTVRFKMKDSYFKNFDVIVDTMIIPKHVYGDVEKSLKMTRTYVGAGPYMLEKFERGQNILVKRFDKWYGFQTPEWKGFFNFALINFRFYKEENVLLEHAKKGDLDFIELRPESYVKKTDGEPWGKTLLKKKVENLEPKTQGFIGWNFRREIFQDKNVRWALAYLLNREEMNKKFKYDMGELLRGPNYNKSEYASPNVKAIPFDPKKAGELLSKAGWKDTDKNGILDKVINGKKIEFRFALIHANKETEKYWTMYKEDLKKAGIEMEIKYLEWNSFLKLIDEGNFDAAAMSWGGGDIDWDPKQIWHSSSAVPGGSNFINYKNPEVDKLIDEARVMVDRNKLLKMLRQVYEKIAADAPYAFLFNDKYYFYGVSSRMQLPADTFKYEVGYKTWWLKP